MEGREKPMDRRSGIEGGANGHHWRACLSIVNVQQESKGEEEDEFNKSKSVAIMNLLF